MTFEDVDNLFTYWRRVPPLPETMYVFAGGDPKNMVPESHQALGPQKIPQIAELKQIADLLNGKR